MDHMIGRWAVCERGRLGSVERWDYVDAGGGVLFEGTGLDGEHWESYFPRFLSIEDGDTLTFLEESYCV